MNEIDTYAQLLCEAIKKSSEYIRYKRAKEELDLHDELREQLDQFRMKCYETQKSAAIEALPDVMEQLCEEQKKLFASPVMMEYITSEQDYCTLIRHQYMKLAGIIDLELT